METPITLPIAFLLDLILGDPVFLPHPIRWMGSAVAFLEPRFRKMIPDLVVSGALFCAVLVLTSWILTFGLLGIARSIHPVAKTVLEIVLIYYAVSVQSLRQAAMAVYDALSRGDLETARRRVSRIIGRDVENLSAAGVASGAMESVAENLVDGVVSPIFYAVIGGAPLAMAFKMVSTLDSMIGYKNEKYIRFGKAAARLDDAANFIPARLSVPVIALAAWILMKRGAVAFRTAVREGSHHTSPNAGYPEAAFAGALGVKLNGPSEYGGVRVDKPFIGIAFERPGFLHIRTACEVMVLSAGLWLAAAWTMGVLMTAS